MPCPLSRLSGSSPALRQAPFGSEPSLDTEPSFDPEVSGPKGGTKCRVEDRAVSEVELPSAGSGPDLQAEFPLTPAYGGIFDCVLSPRGEEKPLPLSAEPSGGTPNQRS